jgi:hypothetical protein
MAKKQKFALATNPTTGQLQWAPAKHGTAQSILGWLLLAASTIAFLLIAGYFVYLYLLTSPGFDIKNLPGGGSSSMRDEVQQLRQNDAHK